MAQKVTHNDLHRVAVTAIVYDDRQRYLIAKRSSTQKVFPNKWTVPGGGVETDDYINTKKTNEDAWYYALEKTLYREVREEVGIEIERPIYLLDLTFIRPDGVAVLVLSYYAKYKSGEVRINEEELTEYAWISVDKLQNYDFISGIDDEILMVDEILKR